MAETDKGFPLLIGPEELGEHDDVVFADVRWYLDGRSARAIYEAGHIPGARFFDLDHDLAEPGDPTEGRHPLPSPSHFAARLEEAGIPAGVPVVAYDDSGGGTAARLVWMLRALGEPAALLDGGIAAYDGPLEVGPGPRPHRVARDPRPWPSALVAGPDDLAEGLLLDARAPERYRGDVEPVDPRPGHIPGAANLPWTVLLDRATGRFASAAELRARFSDVGGADAPVIVSCGSGVTACALAIAHELAGLGPTRLFVASFSGWSSDPSRDVALGS